MISLDREGIVLTYNEAEQKLSRKQSKDVIGRNFFTEIAPCTRVKEFQGRFHDLQEGKSASEEFEFTLLFPHGKERVSIVFLKKGFEESFVIINKVPEDYK